MHKKIQSLIVLSLFSFFVHPTFAADPEAGKMKASACFSCHGQEGNSSNPLYPTLAGQQPDYIKNQLNAFKNSQRNNPIMLGMAKGLSAADIDNLASYFSGIKTKSAGGDTALTQQGSGKASQCFGCHATKAQGRGMFPKLAGQHPAYLAKQLQDFKKGERKSGPMQAITSNLSDSDIAQLSAYLGSL
jgi:cytochrome c553